MEAVHNGLEAPRDEVIELAIDRVERVVDQLGIRLRRTTEDITGD